MSKRIGILTSGGDCAGLNAVIRAVALRAHHGYGWTTIGIGRGTLGLLERPVEAMTLDPARLDSALAREGGTFLGSTNRGNPFAYPMPDGSFKDRSGEMIDGLRQLRLDGLIGVGGDGSLDILRRLLAPSGMPFVGVPKTIDNDVGQTERAVGYSTAVAIATEALDRLQPTGASHERVMVLEVMGRDAGHIAIAAGIAMAIYVSQQSAGIFQYMQTLNAFVAPPFAAILWVGLIWKRTNGAGAMTAVIGGLVTGLAIKLVGYSVDMPSWYYAFANQAAVCLGVSLLLCVVGTLLHPAPSPGTETDPITFWNSRDTLTQGLGDRWYNSVILWAGVLLVLTCACMLIFSQVFFPTGAGP